MDSNTLFVIPFGLLGLRTLPVFQYNWLLWLFTLAGFAALMFLKQALSRAETKSRGRRSSGRRDGVRYERELRAHFERQGYKVAMTERYDWGADLILERDGERILVQAKNHGRAVGQSAVQAVVSSLPIYRGTRAMVASTSGFTPRARSLAKANHVELIEFQPPSSSAA